MYPYGMLLPSMFYHMSTNENAIVGDIPAALISERVYLYGLQNIPLHIRSRLTSPSVTTGTDPRYISFSYNTITNIYIKHNHTLILFHRGIAACDD